MDDDDIEDGDWVVLMNDEAQYALFPASNDVPAGWRVAGPAGPRALCMAYVEEHWTDMRPLSLRTEPQAAP